jgi:hypothetical protein
MSEFRIVEIGGVKMEVDMRYAKNIEMYHVGDKVKVLVKEYSNYKSYAGIIVGFDNFQALPTIVLAYLEPGYSETNIKFVYLNAETKDVELCPMVNDEILFSKDNALSQFDNAILKVEGELEALRNKRAYFVEAFGKAF